MFAHANEMSGPGPAHLATFNARSLDENIDERNPPAPIANNYNSPTSPN